MRNRDRKSATYITRLVARTVLLAAVLAFAVPIAFGDAHAAAPPLTVSGSFALTTSNTGVSFPTTASAPVTQGTHNQFRFSQSGLKFTAVDVSLDPSDSFTVTLVPSSDVVAMIDPTDGSGILSGQFSMTWQQDGQPGPPCTVGPFDVHASTAPFGSSPYSPQTHAVTAVDGAPAIPAAQGCASADVVNEQVPLPVSAPTSPAPANTTPQPAWTTSLTFSAALPNAPTTTPTTTKPPPASTPPPPSTGTPPPARASSGNHAAAHHTTHAAKATAKKTSTTPTTATPPPIDPNTAYYQLPLDPLPAGNASIAGLNGTNNAIDPVPLNAKDETSTTFVIVALALIVVATAVALKLIGRDIRGLLPRVRNNG